VRSETEKLFLKKAYALYLNEVSQNGSFCDALILVHIVITGHLVYKFLASAGAAIFSEKTILGCGTE
jgi:hypothetical protein